MGSDDGRGKGRQQVIENVYHIENLSHNKAQDLLKEIAKTSKRVKLTTHAIERMEQRDISLNQVLQCLSKGVITEGPYRDVRSDWKLTISSYSAGDMVDVACVLKFNAALLRSCAVVTLPYRT